MLQTNFIIIVYFYLLSVERETVLTTIKKIQFLNSIHDDDNDENYSSNSKKFKLIQSKIFDAKKFEKNNDEREVIKTNDIIF